MLLAIYETKWYYLYTSCKQKCGSYERSKGREREREIVHGSNSVTKHNMIRKVTHRGEDKVRNIVKEESV